MKHSKRYKGNRENVDRAKPYSLQDAISIIKEQSRCKFDETVEVAARLGVNPKHADQMVRGRLGPILSGPRIWWKKSRADGLILMSPWPLRI